jgi:hypothetical protein
MTVPVPVPVGMGTRLHPLRVCYVALHRRLRCIAQNCHDMGVGYPLPDEGLPVT